MYSKAYSMAKGQRNATSPANTAPGPSSRRVMLKSWVKRKTVRAFSGAAMSSRQTSAELAHTAASR